jgi:hypothetical protein
LEWTRFDGPHGQITDSAKPGADQQSLHNWVKQDKLDRHERDDGLASAERDELRR